MARLVVHAAKQQILKGDFAPRYFCVMSGGVD